MAEGPCEPEDERKNRTARAIREWLVSKGIKRLRSGGRLGLPEKETLDEWAEILLVHGIEDVGIVELLVERAIAAGNRAGEWRSWSFLTLRIQIGAERTRSTTAEEVRMPDSPVVRQYEAPSDWKLIKGRIRERIPEIAFLNWFDGTRQVDRCGAALVVGVPDEPTAAYIKDEYEGIVHEAAAAEGITQVRFLPTGPTQDADSP